MKNCQEVDWIIWRNFYGDHLGYISADFDLKIKNKSRLEFNLNSNGI
jgi:hypothetical protein